MAVETVTGSLKDLGLTSMGDRFPKLIFEIDEEVVTAGSGTLIPREPVSVIPGSDGSFSVDLHASGETNPYSPYKLTVKWISDGIPRSVTPEWRIFVPVGGGAIAGMVAEVTANKIITKGDDGTDGNVIQQAAIDSLTAKNVTQDGRLDNVESKNTTQDTRLTNVENKNTTQDAALADLPNQYIPLTRGTLNNNTDLNTLITNAHVGDYSLLSTFTYANAPAFAGSATLEVRRGGAVGNTLSVVQRITAGAVALWREATDTGAGTWSAWEQVQTKSAADTKNTEQDGRLTTIEAKNTEQDGRLNGIVMPATTDLDTLRTTNTYYVAAPVDMASQHFPLNATMKVRSDFWTLNDGIQVATMFGSTQYNYSRIRNSSGWSSWNVAPETRLNTAESKITTLENAVIVYGNGYTYPPAAYATDANTKGLWHFDNTLTDASGGGNTLSQVTTHVGNYATDGRFGASSLGSGMYQHIGVDSFLSSTGTTGGTLTTGTVEGWVRSTPYAGIKVAFSHRGWFWVGIAADGTPLASYGPAGSEQTITGSTVLTGTPFASAPWHHLALVFDGANGVRLYVDGKLEGSNSAVATVSSDLGGGFTVGGLQSVPPTFNWELSAGRIDEVRLSNVARYSAAPFYPARPAGLRSGGALFIGPSLPAQRQPFDQWLMTETA